MANAKLRRTESTGNGVHTEHTPAENGTLNTVEGLLKSEHPSGSRHRGAPLKGPHSERTPEVGGLITGETLGDTLHNEKAIGSEFLPPWQKPSSPMPSVYDLGRQIAAMNNRYNELDDEETAFPDPKLHEPLDLTMKRHALSHAKSMAFARERALIDLALTLPAVTIADAAVMVMLAWHVSALLKDCSYDEYEENRKKTQIEHALLNALPLIAKAAGVELGEIGFGGVDIWIERVTQDITGRAGT